MKRARWFHEDDDFQYKLKLIEDKLNEVEHALDGFPPKTPPLVVISDSGKPGAGEWFVEIYCGCVGGGGAASYADCVEQGITIDKAKILGEGYITSAGSYLDGCTIVRRDGDEVIFN